MDSRLPTRLAVIAAALAATAACGGASTIPGPDPDPPRGEVITPEDLEGSSASTVWDALRFKVRFAIFATDGQGRPSGIRTRGRSSVLRPESMLVYLDRVLLSVLGVLADIPLTRVERIVVVRGPEATTYFGTNAGDGVIQVFLGTR